MQDTLTTQSPSTLHTVHCSWCRRVLRLSVAERGEQDSVLRSLGWIVDPPYAPICDICHAEQPWHLPVEDNELAEAMAAEDKAPKQTEAEAAAAYDAETVERVRQLILDLSLTDRITPSAFDQACEVLGVLTCAVNNPSILAWGENCRGERGQATREEAL